MGTTYRELLKEWVIVRDTDYRSDPDRYEAMTAEGWFIMQTILEKLADEEDSRSVQED